MDSYKSHVTSPFQAFGHGLTVYWEIVRVTSTSLTIQHLKYSLFQPRVAILLWALWIVEHYRQNILLISFKSQLPHLAVNSIF